MQNNLYFDARAGASPDALRFREATLEEWRRRGHDLHSIVADPRFRAPAKREVAILKVNKAQFGTAVWLNGKEIGEHLGCFTAGYFNLTGAID